MDQTLERMRILDQDNSIAHEIDDTRDPYAMTIQWYRTLIDPKLFTMPAELDSEELVARIQRQAAVGELLCEKLVICSNPILRVCSYGPARQ